MDIILQFSVLILLYHKANGNVTDILVGHCYSTFGSFPITQASVASLELAAKYVNNLFDDTLNIRVIQTETDCDNIKLAKTTFEYFTELGVDALFGPLCSTGMEKVGSYAAAWDWPVIGYQSAQQSLSNKNMYPTLSRVSFTMNEFGLAAVDLLERFNWTKVAYVYYEGWPCGTTTFAGVFRKAAGIHHIDITLDVAVRVRSDKDELKEVLEEIRKKARIVVICLGGELAYARDFLTEAHKSEMTGPDYAYVAIWGDRVFAKLPWEYGDKKDDLLRELFSKILVMLPEGYYYKTFKGWMKKVEVVTKERFNITEPEFRSRGVQVSLIHDGMLLYAHAVNKCLHKPNCSHTSGKELFDLMRNEEFQGATGHIVMSDTADRLPDYMIQSFRDDDWRTHFALRFEQEFSTTGVLVHRKLELGSAFEWGTEDSKPPQDTPLCDFDGSKCKTDYTVAIITGVLVCILIILIVITLAIRRNKQKFENELLAQSWRIEPEELMAVGANFGSAMKSIHSLRSTSTISQGLVNEGNALCRGRQVMMRTYPQKERIEFTKREDLLILKELRDLQHENVNPFIGICLDKNEVKVVWNYCQKESLEDILYNNEITLDDMFKSSITKDLVRGLQYIHSSKIGAHGQMLIKNCYVDSRWVVKLSDYYVAEVMRPFFQKGAIELAHLKIHELIETAPEVARVLTAMGSVDPPSPEGDIYGLGMIFFHVLFRERPFTFNNIEQEEILESIKKRDGRTLVQPAIPPEESVCAPALITMLEHCWKEGPEERPTIQEVKNIVSRAMNKHSGNLVEHMVKIMEQYAKDLEKMVESRTKELIDERERADQLLFRMLPVSIALKLKQGIYVDPEYFECITLMFTDIVGFTNICSLSTPEQVVEMMNSFYSDFDETSEKFDVYKVETIGDAYMVASGLPIRNGNKHVTEIADLALTYVELTVNKPISHLPGKHIQTRTGIHTGPVAAGVVGLQMPHYCLFGDTVNVASRMESSGLPMKIQLSQTSKEMLETSNNYQIKYRGDVEIKGKGIQATYWLGKNGTTVAEDM